VFTNSQSRGSCARFARRLMTKIIARTAPRPCQALWCTKRCKGCTLRRSLRKTAASRRRFRVKEPPFSARRATSRFPGTSLEAGAAGARVRRTNPSSEISAVRRSRLYYGGQRNAERTRTEHASGDGERIAEAMRQWPRASVTYSVSLSREARLTTVIKTAIADA